MQLVDNSLVGQVFDALFCLEHANELYELNRKIEGEGSKQFVERTFHVHAIQRVCMERLQYLLEEVPQEELNCQITLRYPEKRAQQVKRFFDTIFLESDEDSFC